MPSRLDMAGHTMGFDWALGGGDRGSQFHKQDPNVLVHTPQFNVDHNVVDNISDIAPLWQAVLTSYSD